MEKSVYSCRSAPRGPADVLCAVVYLYLHDVRDITVSQSDQFVLVSYENKVSTAQIGARGPVVWVDVLITP
jgi:hypothetical protein